MNSSTDAETSVGAEWLKSWSNSMTENKKTQDVPLKAKPGLAIGEIDAKSVIPDDIDQLPREIGNIVTSTKIIPIVSPNKATTPKEGSLEDVDLE